MEISWTIRVKNAEVLHIGLVKEKRSNLCRIKRRKTNWIGHNLRTNYLLKRVIE
jgi:hypothetical protein